MSSRPHVLYELSDSTLTLRVTRVSGPRIRLDWQEAASGAIRCL